MLEIKQEMADCQRYHCLPSQLDGEDYHRLQLHRSIEAAEAQYRETERWFAEQRKK